MEPIGTLSNVSARPTASEWFGGRWLKMSSEEKDLYVSAYITGTVTGQHDLCIAQDRRIGEFMDAHKLKHLLFPEDCEQLISNYSYFVPNYSRTRKSRPSAYAKVLDDFYRHPECRMVPYFILLEHLNDKEFVDGDTLFHDVRAGKVDLGFLEIDGVENCYGAERSPR
ncbi:MAG TPA: hypothetical protein VGM11_13615 [Acidobacteriaceae bacterium]